MERDILLEKGTVLSKTVHFENGEETPNSKVTFKIMYEDSMYKVFDNKTQKNEDLSNLRSIELILETLNDNDKYWKELFLIPLKDEEKQLFEKNLKNLEILGIEESDNPYLAISMGEDINIDIYPNHNIKPYFSFKENPDGTARFRTPTYYNLVDYLDFYEIGSMDLLHKILLSDYEN